MKTWLVAFALSGLSLWVQAAEIAGRVVSISDGDTITGLDSQCVQHKARLQGIDAPEKKQPVGQRSKEHLSNQVFNRFVTVQHDKRDRYQRLVGKVMHYGVDVNLGMVSVGFAWHYKDYEKEQSFADRAAYAAAEDDARRARRGLWADPRPVPPWEFRKSER